MAAAIDQSLALDPGGDDHVQLLINQLCDHRRRARRIVRRVTIDQRIDVGLDIVEHPPHDVALPLADFAAHHGSRRLCRFAGAIGGIVVVDVYSRLGQSRAKVGNDLGDRVRFVVAGYEHGYVQVKPSQFSASCNIRRRQAATSIHINEMAGDRSVDCEI